jgi:hypothetical protein
MFAQAQAQAPAQAQTNWFSSFLPSSTIIPVNIPEQANTKAKTMLELFKNVGYTDNTTYYPIFYNRLFGLRGMKSYKLDLKNLFFTDISGNDLNTINLESFKNVFLKNKDKITNNIKKIQTCRDCASQWRDITDEDKNNINNAGQEHSILLEETFNRLQKKYSNDTPGSISQTNWEKICNDINITNNGLITYSELEEFFKKLFSFPPESLQTTTGGKKLRKKSKKHSRKGLHKSRKNNRKSRK